ncbi:MAG: uracil-DNA glycosylase family protein [Candidatus Sulfotelmatobacter sp.]|jgi:hypothetical protein
MEISKSVHADSKAALARERLRRTYRPARVRMLFIGEAPPASGRFFYSANSGLYRAIRRTFIAALPHLADTDFLAAFRELGCYLVDLCGTPVDRLGRKQRTQICDAGEVGLSRTIRQLHPEIIVTVVRSIAANVRRAQQQADWKCTYLELPYPGRWQHHRLAFAKALTPVLRREFAQDSRRT